MIIYYTDDFGGSSGESLMLLSRALEEHTGDAEEARRLTGRLRRGPLGKPVIDGFAPFSVSHADPVWAVLISDVPCGLDVQGERPRHDMAIADRFFAPQDAAELKSFAGDEVMQRELFFRIWTRREALIKAAGRSVTDSSAPAVLSGRASYEGDDWVIDDILPDGIEGLHAAACVRSDCDDREIRLIKLQKEMTDGR